MKKVVLLLIALCAVAGATSVASAEKTANATVSITATGFQPSHVTVHPGDTVTWKNNDSKAHQVVSDTSVFKSNVLQPGDAYSYTFDVESSYGYHDAGSTSMTGVVNVLTSNVSVGVTRIRTVYRSPVRIFGSLPNNATGEAVTLHFSPYGGTPYTKTVVTEQGAYEYTFKPTIRTDVFATWGNTTSKTQPRIGVRPLVIFRALNRSQNLFLVRVKAAKSYAHKLVRIQRQNARGVWVTTRIVRLNARSQARFTGYFPRGTTKAQAWTARTPGYDPGFSVLKLISR